MSQFKIIPGKDLKNDPKDQDDLSPIKFEIQGNNDVSGNGLPITMALCREIIADYILLQKKTFQAVKSLESNETNDIIKNGVDPKKEVVSGIYGRDTLMHILEQKGCEGVRYINCLYGGEKSIVLLGVDKDGEPIGGRVNFQTDNPDKNLVIYEVKGGSQKIRDISKLISRINPKDSEQNPQKYLDLKSEILDTVLSL